LVCSIKCSSRLIGWDIRGIQGCRCTFCHPALCHQVL
jgi:hypothetical protein